jgi:hypothetical protein
MKNPAKVIVHTEQQILRAQRWIWALQILFWVAVVAAVLAAAATLVHGRRSVAPRGQPLPTPNPDTDTATATATESIDKPTQ